MRLHGHVPPRVARAGFALACIASWLAFAAPAFAIDALEFGAPVTLSNPGQTAFGPPQVAVDGAGNAVAVFYAYDGANYIVQSSFRPAGGAFQFPPVYLSTEAQDARDPHVAFDGSGNALAIWTRSDSGSNGTVQAAFRPAAGSFAALPNLSAANATPGLTHIAFDGAGDALAAWNVPDGSEQTAYRPAGGVAPLGGFNGAVTSSPPGAVVSEAQLAVDNAGNALAVWVHSDGSNAIVASSYRPAGGAFGVPIDLSPAGRDAHAPQVAFDAAGNALAVWTRANHGGAQDSVQAALRPAGGAFAAPVDISEDGSLLVQKPQVSFDHAGDALAIWTRSNGSDTVYVQTAFRPAGGSFAAPVSISNPGSASANVGASVPQIAFDGAGDALATWTRSLAGAKDSTQVSFRPAGATFGPPVDLSAPDSSAQQPQVGLDSSGNAVVVWLGDNVVQAAYGSPASSGPSLPPPSVIPVGGGGGGGGGPSSGVAPPRGPFGTAAPVKIVRGGTLVVTVKTPGAGSVTAVASTAKLAALHAAKAKRTVTYGRASAKTKAAQKVTLRIKPTTAAKKLLKQGRRLRVLIKLTFTPAGGGKRVAANAHVTVKLVKKK